ncbi:DUF2867 domain-containing protein [Streptomyces sp. MUM 203J]|uniref:DUF2867 domain-containing protein n=1 Tax=Streptomyces sp. MUM 203J TaxID=2791990 RepID=UPI001F037B58|nr:DUF2867 domain-containing protein [Streptomyces sp. MUM 203J]MCH0541426.1 DUF2867 domain-containing protein [Streptomyces sp. MUM 203J]
MKVASCPIPDGTALARFRDSGAYTHAEAAESPLPERGKVGARELARLTMDRPSLTPERAFRLVDLWIRVQGLLLRPFGVKPNTMRSGQEQPLPEAGGRLGPYEVFEADDREVLLGDTDKFLEHRMAFVVADGKAYIGVVLRTLNEQGEAYWNQFRHNQTQILHESLRRGLTRAAESADGAVGRGTTADR